MQTYEEAMAEAIELGLMTPTGTATDRCQCPTCKAVFTTDGNFAKHRTGGICVPPVSVGMIQAEGGWWHEPGPEDRPWVWSQATA